jgi:uncharacterized protein YcaQ
MPPDTISKLTARRFVLGRQGLWPGRRWAGKDGAAAALHAAEAVQMDPLTVVARSHDIALWGRVLDYQPEHLHRLLYEDREFFDYGGALFVYPMAELPYWRQQMARGRDVPRWAEFAAEHAALLDEVRDELRARGPLGNRDFADRPRVNSYRGRKDTGPALFYLWYTGELLIHHRDGFERVYDFRDNVAPAAHNWIAGEDDAERFFGRKSVAFYGLIPEGLWLSSLVGSLHGRIGRPGAQQRLAELIEAGVLLPVGVEGQRQRHFMLAEDLPLLDAVAVGQVPEAWRPLGPATTDEVTFLAPLDIVSARGRAARLFDFDYVWEVYKPAAARRWGYYVLPILYGDRLVARLDPKLDRATGTLHILGFWLEDHASTEDAAFVMALARGLARFAAFVGAGRVDLAAVEPRPLRRQLAAQLKLSGL